ncbi:Unknown protein sequence [Pseudomonas amygdali pv. lachrymans]|uniref:Uncharacterized protein n=1 Tax=Pseudomonas amygdali pv. lachrymans TaxID=53707 RepID=A0ABR5KS67_PSEAV|nr:Unknown protein sequence [Pseudomonas amygdali pv. lachrymans]
MYAVYQLLSKRQRSKGMFSNKLFWGLQANFGYKKPGCCRAFSDCLYQRRLSKREV